jgi:HAD superfamily hydrolase (TIGR01509 family)
MMNIKEIIELPPASKALLFDMDGVLLDSLGLDLSLCGNLLHKHLGQEISLPKDFIRSIFAYHPAEFWQRIFSFVARQYKHTAATEVQAALLEEYNQARKTAVFPVNPGILTLLQGCKEQGLKRAVVSNNPTEDVQEILRQSEILEYFDTVVGNDVEQLQPKPAPDTYIHAAQLLGLRPEQCVVLEDSLLGAEAGFRAGCFTIGVATGGSSFSDLEHCGWTHRVYTAFHVPRCRLNLGPVTQKSIQSPNDFVSHAVEHLAWRLGSSIALLWLNNDWFQLGKILGQHIARFPRHAEGAAALGMIDDGSAETCITLREEPGAEIQARSGIDLTWFLSLRCEQLHSGGPLVDLLQGLSQGLKARIRVRLCSAEDPHHAWEGIFRSVGISLSKLFAPESIPDPEEKEELRAAHAVVIETLSASKVILVRTTAESRVRVSVDLSQHQAGSYTFQVPPSLPVHGFADLLEQMAFEAGWTLMVDFQAEQLSSSHVVMEDIGLVLGRGLKEVLVLRMHAAGVQGAGSSMQTREDYANQVLSVGVSVEGRKFLQFVPFTEAYSAFRQNFLIGHNIGAGLFSEDLDDFLDGLAGGLECSLIIHIRQTVEPARGWPLLFSHLGRAFKEVFQENRRRKGVPPGVKATLI